MPEERVVLHHPSRSQDPFNLDSFKHYRMQAKEKERFLEERSSLPDEKRRMQVDPAYIDAMLPVFIFFYAAEAAAVSYIGEVAHSAPFEALKTTAVCRQMDELNHAELDKTVLHAVGFTNEQIEGLWKENPEYGIFRHLLSLTDPYEIVLKADFIGEGSIALITQKGYMHECCDGSRRSPWRDQQ
jgi:hypothetical protein